MRAGCATASRDAGADTTGESAIHLACATEVAEIFARDLSPFDNAERSHEMSSISTELHVCIPPINNASRLPPPSIPSSLPSLPQFHPPSAPLPSSFNPLCCLPLDICVPQCPLSPSPSIPAPFQFQQCLPSFPNSSLTLSVSRARGGGLRHTN